MSRYDYLCDSEHNNNYGDCRNDWYMYNYPLTTPRVVVKTISETEFVSKSPYIDQNTHTWWQYDDTQKKYVDTGISPSAEIGEATEEQIINIVNKQLLESDNIVNDDEALSIEEVEDILDGVDDIIQEMEDIINE